MRGGFWGHLPARSASSRSPSPARGRGRSGGPPPAPPPPPAPSDQTGTRDQTIRRRRIRRAPYPKGLVTLTETPILETDTHAGVRT
eukprot:2715580-Pyramimonas_sp.AAC.1